MKRTGFKRPEPRTLSPFKRAELPRRSGPIKRKAPKKRAGQDKAMLAACRGQICWLFLPGVCLGRNDTVVPAHRNEGKGMGLKVPDAFTVPACQECHAEYDQGRRFLREEKRAMFDAAYARWSAYRDGAREAA